MKYLIGFVGYGEAAYNISLGLASEGLKDMAAFDMMQDHPEKGEKIQKRAEEVGIPLSSSLKELCENSKFIISLTSPAVCIDVAKQILPHLTAGQVLCDLNSSDPEDMKIIDQLPRPDGVKFVDVALLGAVPKGKHRTKMYISGDGGQEYYDMIKQWNTVPKLLSTPAGSASAIKMFKSVFSKGIMQLMLETYVPAAKYGVLDEIIGLTKDTFKNRNIEEFCEENMFRTLIHAERRSAESAACARTVERLGYDASISQATYKKLCILAKQNYKERIGDATPGLRETVEMVAKDTYEK